MAGQSVGMVTREQPAAEIIAELVGPGGRRPGRARAMWSAPTEPASAEERGRRLMPQPACASRLPACLLRGCATSWPAAGSAQERLDRDRHADRRRAWSPRCARSTSCAPARCSSCSPPRACKAGGGAQDPPAGRRGPGRRHRRPCAAAGAGRRAVASQFRLPPGDRRGDLPLADGRADPARRPRARRAGGAEPHARGNTPRTRSRRSRPSPWCWPSWSPAASWSARDEMRSSRGHRRCCRCASRACRSMPALAHRAGACCTSRAS